jgi:hypothetical protein
MPRSQRADRSRASRMIAVLAALALPAAVPACSSPTAPIDPPGGGEELVLSFEQFEQTVEPLLIRHGCDAAGDCHGGGIRGSFELSPAGAKDARFDFDQSALQVWPTARERSPILTEPLALEAGGTPHGVKPFASAEDSDYRAILRWILDGARR